MLPFSKYVIMFLCFCFVWCLVMINLPFQKLSTEFKEALLFNIPALHTKAAYKQVTVWNVFFGCDPQDLGSKVESMSFMMVSTLRQRSEGVVHQAAMLSTW